MHHMVVVVVVVVCVCVCVRPPVHPLDCPPAHRQDRPPITTTTPSTSCSGCCIDVRMTLLQARVGSVSTGCQGVAMLPLGVRVGSLSPTLCMYIYIYIYIYLLGYLYIYIYSCYANSQQRGVCAQTRTVFRDVQTDRKLPWETHWWYNTPRNHSPITSLGVARRQPFWAHNVLAMCRNWCEMKLLPATTTTSTVWRVAWWCPRWTYIS